jgi:energy-coupling factor transporter ATP-binding protein EcfA2
MRLTSLTLHRFKGFEQAEFDIAPLTVLIGPNNSGKSSVLQSLALLAQSAAAGGIAVSGPIVDLGRDAAALTHRASANSGRAEPWAVTVGWEGTTAAAPVGDDTLDVTVELRLEPDPIANISTQTVVTIRGDKYAETVVSVRFPPEPATLSIVASTKDGIGTPDIRTQLEDRVMGPWNVELGPPRPTETVKDRPELNFWLVANRYLGSMAQRVQAFRYVGPERTVTESVFGLGAAAPPNPRTAQEMVDALAYNRESLRAVSARCEGVFGFGVDIELMEGRQVALTAVSPQGVRLNAVNVGSGLVQLVWIVLQLELAVQQSAAAHAGLSATVGIEEPEIHLHPAKQPDMARILADYAREGTGVICTTQSEHLLMAILQMVADGSLRPEDLAVYYLQDGGASRLTVDDRGRLSEGLRGFFEVNEAELLRRLESLIGRG